MVIFTWKSPQSHHVETTWIFPCRYSYVVTTWQIPHGTYHLVTTWVPRGNHMVCKLGKNVIDKRTIVSQLPTHTPCINILVSQKFAVGTSSAQQNCH